MEVVGGMDKNNNEVWTRTNFYCFYGNNGKDRTQLGEMVQQTFIITTRAYILVRKEFV